MADESADNRTSVTLDEALAWIKVISRSRLLAILREPNRESVDAIAFAGFRRNAEVIAHPVIIRRLALEATRNPDFAESLRTAAEEVAARRCRCRSKGRRRITFRERSCGGLKVSPGA